MIFLAHGLLGIYDELIFLAIAVIFIAMMGVAWWRSRSLPLNPTDDDSPYYEESPRGESDEDKDRFRLD